MKLFCIGDTHLPSTRNKTMDRFGWTNHPVPLGQNWDAKVGADDVVIIAGDISWASRAHEVMDDLKWLDERPGKKVLLRGNHDFWWGDSLSKLKTVCAPFRTFVGFLHNCSVQVGPFLIAGSRLWTAPEAPPMPGGEMGDEEVKPDFVERENNRLKLSIEDANKRGAGKDLLRVAAVHFPPLYSNEKDTAFSKTIEAWGPATCVYGHLHGPGISAGFQGMHGNVKYVLASCDAAQFSPVLLHEA